MRAVLLLTALVVLTVPFALLLGLVEARWEPLRAVDQGVAQALHSLATGHPVVVAVMQAVSDLGGSTTWWVLHSAATLYLLVRRLPRLALFVAVTAAGGGLLNLAVKAAVSRDRPDLPEQVSHAPGFAFPSGHTMGSAIGVSVLLLVFLPVLAPRWRRPAVAAGALFALAVGLSRIVLGVHWVSDVVGGWLLSLAWVLAMVAVFRAWQRESGRPQPTQAADVVEERLRARPRNDRLRDTHR